MGRKFWRIVIAAGGKEEKAEVVVVAVQEEEGWVKRKRPYPSRGLGPTAV